MRVKVIKFKGFNKKNSVWLYGFYLQNRGAHFVCPDEFAVGKTWEDYEVDPSTVKQLLYVTKEGKEIYEDDDLHIEGHLESYKAKMGEPYGIENEHHKGRLPVVISISKILKES